MRNIIASQKLTESQTIVIVEMVLKKNRWAGRRGAVKLLVTDQEGIDNLYEVEKIIGNPHCLEIDSFCFDLEKVGPGSEYNEKLAEMEAQLEEIISMQARENHELKKFGQRSGYDSQLAYRRLSVADMVVLLLKKGAFKKLASESMRGHL